MRRGPLLVAWREPLPNVTAAMRNPRPPSRARSESGTDSTGKSPVVGTYFSRFLTPFGDSLVYSSLGILRSEIASGRTTQLATSAEVTMTARVERRLATRLVFPSAIGGKAIDAKPRTPQRPTR